ncbi:hypothetical protein HZA39_02595 [Candidatus Peregrinibacteria bacterium]|nr:hypothetical protein [Candidatus Peregrinibacteria bacterium]
MAENKTLKERLFEFIAAKPVESDIELAKIPAVPAALAPPSALTAVPAATVSVPATAAASAAPTLVSAAVSSPASSVAPAQVSAAVSSPASSVAPAQVSAPSVSVSAAAAAPKKDEDVFLTKLFEKKATEEKSESKLMKGLVETEEKQAEKRSILGKAPEVDTKLFIDIEYHLKQKLAIVKTAFIGLCVLSALIVAISYSILDSEYNFFWPNNIGRQFDIENQNLINKQNETNRLYYQNFKKGIDQLIFIGADFTQKYNEYNLASDSKKPLIKTDLDKSYESVGNKFDEISKTVTEYKNYKDTAVQEQMTAIDAEKRFNQLLRDADEKDLLPLIEDPDDQGNKPLAGIFKNKKASDWKTYEDAKLMLADINSKYSNTFTTFNKIKNSRNKWSKYLKEINEITQAVDPSYKPDLFGSDFSVDVGIKYTGFNIDENNAIKISGGAETADSKTFTLLAKLVDKFKESLAFKNADMKTFSKNRNEQTGKYTSTFSITAELNPEWNK